MKLTFKNLLTYSVVLTWFILALALSLISSQHSYIQFFVFPSWSDFVEHLARIAAVPFVFGLLAALLGVMLFSLASLSLGLRVLQGKAGFRKADLALGTTAFVVGEIIFSLIFLTLISVYRLTPIIGAGALIFGFLVGLPAFTSFLGQLPRPKLPADLRPEGSIILGLIVLVFFLGLLSSSARLGYDAVVEYFSHAKIMATSQSRILLFPRDPFLVSSLHPGILFTALIQLFGDQSARMLPWVNALAILLLGLAIAKELGLTPRTQLWFLSLMITSTAFLDLLGDGKVELISTAPLLAAVYWMLRSSREPSKGIFALIGFLAGFAIIARPYNIFLASLFIAVYYLGQGLIQYRARTFKFQGFVRSAIWILPPLVALGSFHLLQNWLWLKTPLAPLIYGRSLKASDWQWQFDPALLNAYRLLYPFAVTYVNSPQSLGNISPLFVAFLPFLLVRQIRDDIRQRSTMVWLSLTAIATLVLWIAFFFTVVEIRYVLFLWVLLFLPMANIIESAGQHMTSVIRPLLHAAVGGLIAYMGIRTLIIAFDTYSPVDKKGQAHCYDLGFCAFLEPLNQSAAQGDRVLVLNAYRYYLRPDLFACSTRADEYAKLESLASQNSPDFWVEVYRQGYQYLAYETNYAKIHSHFGTIPAPAIAPDWMRVTTISSTTDELEIVYRIKAGHAPIKPEVKCQLDSAGIWEVRSSSMPGQDAGRTSP